MYKAQKDTGQDTLAKLIVIHIYSIINPVHIYECGKCTRHEQKHVLTRQASMAICTTISFMESMIT